MNTRLAVYYMVSLLSKHLLRELTETVVADDAADGEFVPCIWIAVPTHKHQ